jgi:hypothetical protein
VETKPTEIDDLIDCLEKADKKSVRRAVDKLTQLAQQTPEVGEKLERRWGENRATGRWPLAYTLAQSPPPRARDWTY